MARARLAVVVSLVGLIIGLARPVSAGPAVTAALVQTLKQPVAMTTRPGEPDAVYIAQKAGAVRRLLIAPDGSVTLDATVVLNLSKVASSKGSRGLLGIAFNPAGTKFYAFYSTLTNTSRVSEFPYNGTRALKKKQRVLLEFAIPANSAHYGGTIGFGPDSLLYISTGDGGAYPATTSPAQDLTSLLGKILRIDPKASALLPYTVPPTNPFLGRADARPEIFHLGLRNPWKWSFDRATGDQWIADVGEDTWEEVDHLPPGIGGANFGWILREGTDPFNGGAPPLGNVDPVYEYRHTNGNCSITGGYVYRGTAIADLAGAYVFSDYCGGVIQARHDDGTVDSFVTVSQPVGFGQDSQGELWVLSLGGGVYRLQPA